MTHEGATDLLSVFAALPLQLVFLGTRFQSWMLYPYPNTLPNLLRRQKNVFRSFQNKLWLTLSDLPHRVTPQTSRDDALTYLGDP